MRPHPCSCEDQAAKHADPDSLIAAKKMHVDEKDPGPPFQPGQDGTPIYNVVCDACARRWQIEVDQGGHFTIYRWSQLGW